MTDAPFVEKFIIHRKGGRIHYVEAFDVKGNVLCKLPLTAVTMTDIAWDRSGFAFNVDGTRVGFVDDPLAVEERPTESFPVVPRAVVDAPQA
jgi:hypothetical protein